MSKTTTDYAAWTQHERAEEMAKRIGWKFDTLPTCADAWISPTTGHGYFKIPWAVDDVEKRRGAMEGPDRPLGWLTKNGYAWAICDKRVTIFKDGENCAQDHDGTPASIARAISICFLRTTEKEIPNGG